MAISIENINTAGAVVTVGGTVNAADSDGYYWGTTGGTDVGCTTDGVSVTYSFDKTDIFCDQTLAAVDSSVTGENCEVKFSLLETDATKLKVALQNCEYTENVGVDRKIGIGGKRSFTFIPLMLEVADNDTGLLTTWTFYKVLSSSFEIKFERENPSKVAVTFTAYAETSHAVGHQLFSIHEDIDVTP